MTTTRSEGATTAQAKPGPMSHYRVGPVITTVAAVVSAVIMFGIGVVAGMAAASALGLHDDARTALMLVLGVTLGLGSVVASARRHLPGKG